MKPSGFYVDPRLTSETLFPLSIGYKQKKAVTK